MSGISFKITAPPRASSSSAPPSRPSSAASRARPSPAPRHDHDHSDSDDDDAAFARAAGRDNKRRRVADEEVVEFGREGATSKYAKPAPAGPLVIPALPNKDWRKAAEELRAGRPARGAAAHAKKREIYLPETSGGMRMSTTSATPSTTSTGTSTPVTDGADRINAQEVVGGLDLPGRLKRGETEDAIERVRQEVEVVEVATPPAPAPPPEERPGETEEQRALRELLSGGEGATEQRPSVEVIYSGQDERNAPIEEADAFKRDVESRPDMASLEDYARVPVGEFGLAMLRGMGWAPGQAASRSGRGAIEAHVPSSRPALLGIGAKPMAEAMGEGGKGKDAKGARGKGGERKSRRDEMRFVPLVKQAREGGGGGSGRSTPLTTADSSASSSRRASRSPPRLAPSGGSSRHASRSPPPSSSSRRDRGGDRERSPRRDRDYERRSSRYDDRDRDRDHKDRDRSDRRRDDRDRDRDRDRERSDRRREDRDRDDRRTRDDRDRERDREREREREKGRRY
ncbi:hypothetical protein JCM5296_001401 [Sporobolomyces johnsonii]